MSVLLPNADLGLRPRIEAPRNSHGEHTAAGWGEIQGPHPGRTSEGADGTWSLGLDPLLWPVREGDLVISATGTSWLVRTSDLLRNNYDPTVDWVRVTALHRSLGGTEPGDAWFVARYASGAEPAPPTLPPGPVQDATGLWNGYGPPPSTDFGAQPGQEYLDLTTGIIYQLG